MAKGKKDNTAESEKIEQYCSVCGKKFLMPVVEVAEGNKVLWLKCPGCAGVLPHMLDNESLQEEEEVRDEQEDEEEELAIEDIDTDRARQYDQSESYEVGDIIYHRSWNDYGKVMEKQTLPGNRHTILVHFVNQGKIRLVESKE